MPPIQRPLAFLTQPGFIRPDDFSIAVPVALQDIFGDTSATCYLVHTGQVAVQYGEGAHSIEALGLSGTDLASLFSYLMVSDATADGLVRAVTRQLSGQALGSRTPTRTNLVEMDTVTPAVALPAVRESETEEGIPLLMLLGHDPNDSSAYFACDLSNMSKDRIVRFFSEGSCSSFLKTIRFEYLRKVLTKLLREEDSAALSIAGGLCQFHRSNPYCARCGRPTRIQKNGLSRVCPGCGSQIYPRQDPAMLVLVTCGPYCLLGRKEDWAPGRYSGLAGYTEIGECIEETVIREVKDEADVNIPYFSLRYVGSQPWLFPQALMFGFHAELCPNFLRLPSGALEVPRLSGPTVEEFVSKNPECIPERKHGHGDTVPIAKSKYRHLTELEAILPERFRRQMLPLTTRGGFSFLNHRATVFLPLAKPDGLEMEDVFWCHEDLLFFYVNEAEKEPIPPNLFHLPPRYALARSLLDQWLGELSIEHALVSPAT